MTQKNDPHELDGIAIVGMAGRFPGADGLGGFWSNIKNGVESIITLSDKALAEAGVDPAAGANPHYVKRASVLDRIEWFDSSFFGINRREAELMDPQQRIFLECAWEALEHAGHGAAKNRPGRIGVYAGAGFNAYLLRNLGPTVHELSELEQYQVFINNDKDFLATRVAHRLNLKGPAITLQTACSTSLVSVCTAALHLLTHQCDMALAGGVSVRVPQHAGYFYEDGGLASPDGCCRAFDAEARGTVFGSGAGVVVLRRLEDAIADRDRVWAVIKGFALNNDGADKASFTAPGVEGQTEVVASALAMAGFDARTMGYVETHGTATALGDPIEITALARAFRQNIQDNELDCADAGANRQPPRGPEHGFCAIGSVKTNVGHLDVAAGVTGLIKTALALHEGLIPPSLHYQRPNPLIDFPSTPFYVNTALSPWKKGPTPRRAGVSAFGVGGTNAHVVLEQAPPLAHGAPDAPCYLLPLSARTPSALAQMAANLKACLRDTPEIRLGDVAFTLQAGRETFACRRVVICGTVAEAVAGLEASTALWPDPGRRLETGGREDAAYRARLVAAAARWLDGEAIDWFEAQRLDQAVRVPLPAYPFERQRYWIEPGRAPRSGSGPVNPGPSFIDMMLSPAAEVGARDEKEDSHGVYALSWEVRPAPGQQPEGPVAVLAEAPAPPLAEALTRHLAAQGVEVRALAAAESAGRLPQGQAGHIVRFWSGCPNLASPGQVADRLAEALESLQVLLSSDKPAALTWVFQGAQRVLEDEVPDPALASLWALGRSCALEQPQLRFNLVDVDAETSLDALMTALWRREDAPAIALRRGRCYAPRLAPLAAAAEQRTPWGGERDAWVLITGGLGGLGLRVAEHLARVHGVRKLLLVGRTAPGAGQRATLAVLEALGAAVKPVLIDVADRPALARLLETHPVRGIIHAAGVIDDGIVPHLNRQRLEQVLRPKLSGAWNLHELTHGHPLEFFVLFSSLAAVMGVPGQSGYAAANACLDALAQHRRALGLPALSINWGPWSEVGMAARGGPAARRLAERFGLKALSPEAGLALLDACVCQGTAQVAVVNRGFLFAPQGFHAAASPLQPETSAIKDWRNLPAPQRSAALLRLVQEEAARLLGLSSPEAVAPAADLSDLGMDSLASVEFRSALSRKLAVPIPASALFDHPNATALARFLAEALDEPPRFENAVGEGANGASASGGVQDPLVRAIHRLHPVLPNPPIFFIGGAVSLDELYMRDIALELGPLQPSYALSFPGLSEGEAPLRRVDALADYFLARIKAFQANGPLVLAGHSSGGGVALEMALRLSRAGQEVVELILLDAPLFAEDQEPGAGSQGFWQETSLRGYLTKLKAAGWLPGELGEKIEQSLSQPRAWDRLEQTWQANMAAMASYRPARQYYGEVTYITPGNDWEGLAGNIDLWRSICPSLKVARTGGNHFTMVRAPHAKKTAQIIRRLFSRSDLDEF